MNEYLIVKNPDEKVRREIIARIKANDGYCPCQFEKTPDTKCHCREFKETGDCICGLFIKVPCIEIIEGE